MQSMGLGRGELYAYLMPPTHIPFLKGHKLQLTSMAFKKKFSHCTEAAPALHSQLRNPQGRAYFQFCFLFSAPSPISIRGGTVKSSHAEGKGELLGRVGEHCLEFQVQSDQQTARGPISSRDSATRCSLTCSFNLTF